jgi:hypothetical protein
MSLLPLHRQRTTAWTLWLSASLLCALACAPTDDGKPHQQPSVTPVEGEPIGECSAVLRSYEAPPATHLPECSNIVYSTSPPTFGDHYPSWAAYQTYDFALPLGYLVHDLEHGAVVLFYDCPEGCADELESAKAFIAALPDDPRCSQAVRVQVILLPRPDLGARWAAAAWGHSLTADCLDPDIFGKFYEDHHGQGPEDLCNQGVVYAADACQ